MQPASRDQPGNTPGNTPRDRSGDQQQGRGLVGWVERGLAASPWLVLIAVVVLVLAALGAFVYGADVFFGNIGEVVKRPLPVGSRIGLFLLVIDLFLVGATLLIGALGFYELFIGRHGPWGLPRWLQMRDLNDLKARVIAMVVLVAAVSFVEVVVDIPTAGMEVLEVGGGVGFVVLALTVFLRFGTARGAEEGGEGPPDHGTDPRATPTGDRR